MRFFDYIFFRIYIAFRNRGEEQVFGPSLYVGACIVSIMSPIWLGAYSLFATNSSLSYSHVITIVIFLWSYWRYKRKKNQILYRFEKSLYNKRIHIFVIYSMLIVFFAIGVSLAVLLKSYILEPYHIEGILGKWIVLK